MTTSTIEQAEPHTCWCCGQVTDVERMAHLGNHPEVTVCVRCARSLYRWARAADERASRTPGARLRRASLIVRRRIVRGGWPRRGPLGRILRWAGRRLP